MSLHPGPLAQLAPTSGARAQVLREPIVRGWLIGACLLVALSAFGGGFALIVWRDDFTMFSPALIEHTPFSTFLVPGLLLAIVIGGSNLAAAVLVKRRSAFALDAVLIAGGALTVWIVAELAMMRELHFLHVTYGALGIAILVPGIRAAWRSGAARHRWLILVTGAETLGFLAPALTGIAMASAGAGELAMLAAMVGAGFVEGLVLGAGQARALTVPVDRRWFAVLTACGAALVWGAVMAARLLAIPFAAIAGVLGLAAIGSAQWLELRRHVPRAHAWIGWTALAWLLALPLGFAAGSFVDEATPVWVHIVLWSQGGMLMAFVMALVTWQGVRGLGCSRSPR